MEYLIRNMPYGVECLFCHTTDDGIDVNGNILLNDVNENPVNKINEYIERQLMEIESQQQSQITEKPSILSFLESDKERIKWVTIFYIKSNPTHQISTYLNTLQTRDAILAQLLIIEYARAAYNNGFVPTFSENLEDCWNILKGLAINMTEEQIRQEL